MITRRRRTNTPSTWLKWLGRSSIVAIIFWVFILIYDFCTKKNCIDTSILNKAAFSQDIGYKKPKGLDKYFDGNTVTVELTSDDLERIKRDSTVLNKVFIEKLREILSDNRANFEEMNINPDILFARQEEAYQKNQLINNLYDIGSIIKPVLILRHEDHIDSGIKIKTPQGYEFEVSNDCSVKSSFQVNISKRPLEDKFLSELEGKINNNRVMKEYLNRVKQNPVNCPFDMCAIAQLIRGDRGFQREIENLCRENQNFLSLFRSNNNFTNDCFNQFFFSRGQYAIENIYEIFVKSYVKSLEGYFKQHPNEEFEILCQGYADPTNVFSGIPLSEKVYYDEKSNNKIDFDNPSYNSIGGTITNNMQLSYVRAFSGIKKIHDGLEAYPSISKKLHFYYQGMGIGQGNDECSRKIQFHISRIN